MRAQRLTLALLMVAVAGCAPAAAGGQISSTPGAGDVWAVGVYLPEFSGDSSECTEDASVDLAVQSLDLPSSRFGVTLKPGSTREDAQRVATCLQSMLTSGDISITEPAAP